MLVCKWCFKWHQTHSRITQGLHDRLKSVTKKTQDQFLRLRTNYYLVQKRGRGVVGKFKSQPQSPSLKVVCLHI